ncbi:MAG: DUF1820 family protein [Gammaproteobacteria bacterium]|nr:DUF1820 family protein [Gammaproteobacteria bacterium]
MAKKRLYRIQFINQDKVYQIYARRVSQGELLGFVAVEGLTFGDASSLVIDPAEDRLKSEFEGVNTTYIPLHAVIRIDQVDKSGTAKILEFDVPEGNVIPYPFPPGTPRKR